VIRESLMFTWAKPEMVKPAIQTQKKDKRIVKRKH
jgi:hypothetical protein